MFGVLRQGYCVGEVGTQGCPLTCRTEGMGVKCGLYAAGLIVDNTCEIGGGFCICMLFGLNCLDGVFILEPFVVVNIEQLIICIMTELLSLGFWERFGGVSFCCLITLTGKRFTIIVDNELSEVVGDLDGW